MAYLRLSIATITTGGSTGIDVYTDNAINGFLYGIHYAVGSPILPSTAVITVSGERTGVNYFTRSASTGEWIQYPRMMVATSSGGTSTDATLHYEMIPVVDERLKVTIAGATSGVAGSIEFVTEGY